MAIGGVSERKERLRRLNIERNIKELREELIQWRREARAQEKHGNSGLYNRQPVPHLFQGDADRIEPDQEIETIDQYNRNRIEPGQEIEAADQDHVPVTEETVEDRSITREKEHSSFRQASVFDLNEFEEVMDNIRRTLDNTRHTLRGSSSNKSTLDEYQEYIQEEKKKLQEKETDLHNRLQLLAHKEHLQKAREDKMRDYLRQKDRV